MYGLNSLSKEELIFLYSHLQYPQDKGLAEKYYIVVKALTVRISELEAMGK